jgi:CBS domain-containing protein
MRNYRAHLILIGSSVKQALELLNNLSIDAILFVVDHDNKLFGSLTDGDIRRGLLQGFTLENSKFIAL